MELGCTYRMAELQKERSKLLTFFCSRPEGCKCDIWERYGKCVQGYHSCPHLKVSSEQTTTRRSKSFHTKDNELRKKRDSSKEFRSIYLNTLGVCGEYIAFPYNFKTYYYDVPDLVNRKFLPIEKFNVDWLVSVLDSRPFLVNIAGGNEHRLFLFHLEHMFPDLFLEYTLVSDQEVVEYSPSFDDFENLSAPIRLFGKDCVGCKVMGREAEVIDYDDGVIVVRADNRFLMSSLAVGEVEVKFRPNADVELMIDDIELQRKMLSRHPWLALERNLKK